ncbi:MAG TPA: ankyrin repeat domain-containing protein [Luteitalea sp.]|nr:ankyrin repeat domain-containing protein [Luteitalea sp.]
MAATLLDHRANPTTNVYAATSALYGAYKRQDHALITLLERHGGRLNAVGVGALGLSEQASRWLADSASSHPAEASRDGAAIPRDLLWGATECPLPDVIALVLPRVDWPRDDRRWYGILENGPYLDRASDRPRHLQAFRLVLDRSDPNVRSARGTTLLHEIAASRGELTAEDRVAYASLVLDAGARVDIRDDLLRSTALGWACRWGRLDLVELLLGHGADPFEADAEPWATPLAWATKAGHDDIATLLADRPMARPAND